jgi:hypothetical protein
MSDLKPSEMLDIIAGLTVDVMLCKCWVCGTVLPVFIQHSLIHPKGMSDAVKLR